MPTPTASDVHVPTAIGNNKKGKPTMAGKPRMDDPDDAATMKKLGKKLGKVPPQFLPKQKDGKGDDAKGGKPAVKGKPFAKGK